MSYTVESRIIEKYESLGLDVLMILKCERAGDVVDNGFGLEFALPEYAVISDKSPLFSISDEEYASLCEFEFNNNYEIMKFGDDVYDTDRLIEGLKSDGYKIIWKQ